MVCILICADAASLRNNGVKCAGKTMAATNVHRHTAQFGSFKPRPV